jgi:hypothetical protein
MSTPASHYRFTLDVALTSMLGSPSRDKTMRNVPGGRRLYLEYSGKTTTDPAQKASLDADLDAEIAAAIKNAGETAVVRAFLLELKERIREGTDAKEDCAALTAAEAALNAPTGQAVPASIKAAAVAIGAYDEKENAYAKSERYPEKPFDAAAGAAGFWTGLAGEVITSGDWALVREDGLLILDSRFTIRARDGALISATLAGSANLASVYGSVKGENPYDKWCNDDLPATRDLPIAVTLRFNAPTFPGNESILAARRYRLATKNYWKYVSLGQALFVGGGHVTLALGSDGKANPETGIATNLKVDVYELVPA